MLYKLSEIKKDKQLEIINEIYDFTSFLTKQYPNYKKWFYDTNLPRISNNTGDILYAELKNEIVGICIIKNTKNEKKICTLYVSPEYQNTGIGSKLLNKAIISLGTTKPVISIPTEKIDMFQSFINKYNWTISYISDKYNSEEIFFNI